MSAPAPSAICSASSFRLRCGSRISASLYGAEALVCTPPAAARAR